MRVAPERESDYLCRMDDPSTVPPCEWLDALDRADADVAAGRTVSGESVMGRLRRALDDMEARAAGKQPDEVVGSR